MIFVKFEFQLHFKTSVLFILVFGRRKKKGVSQQDRGRRPPGLSFKTMRDRVSVSKHSARVSCRGPAGDSLWEQLKHPSTDVLHFLWPFWLLMLSDPGYAEIRDGDIPEDTVPLQVAANLSDITQNGPVSCLEAHSACASWMSRGSRDTAEELAVVQW